MWIGEIENQCILGLDFLRPNGCVVDVADGCIRVGTQEIQLQRLGEPTSKRALPSEIILARTVIDLGKPTFAVRVMNLADEQE